MWTVIRVSNPLDHAIAFILELKDSVNVITC